jgi:hypothetical protein
VPEKSAPADRAKTALNFLVVVDCNFLLATLKNNILFRPRVNGQYRSRVHSAAGVAMAGVDEIAVLLDNDFYRTADTIPMNVVHVFSLLSFNEHNRYL